LTEDNYNEFVSNNRKVRKVIINARWYSFKEQLVVSSIIKKQKVELMHFPHFNVPLYYNQRFIITIHDLIIDHFPDSRATNLPPWHYKIKLWGYKKILNHAVQRAEKIIVPSNFVKTDLISLYQVPADKIKVIYEGYFLEETQEPIDISRFKITKPFLLFVGAAYPHKNLERLIGAFHRINKNRKCQLVLVGKTDEFYQQMQKRIDDNDIIFTGFISESELKGLYQKALVYVFPSLYEGFGLPPIEAQAQKLPVVSSNRSSLPEILGDSVLYFNPEDEQEMAEKIQLLLQSKTKRQELIVKGLANIKRFSWEKMIKETLELYNRK